MVLPLVWLLVPILPIPIYGVAAMLLNDDNVGRKVLEAMKEDD